MKTSSKIFAAVCSLLAVAGIALCIVGIVLGADVKDGLKNIRGNISFGMANTKEVNESFGADKVDALDMRIKATDMTIKTHDKNEIIIRGDVLEKAEIKLDGDTIVYRDPDNLFTINTSDLNLEILIPEGFEFEKTQIKAGAGKLELLDFASEKLKIDCGAGNIICDNLTCKEEFLVEVGAGSFEVDDGVIGKAEFDCGVGKMVYSGIITDDVDINGGVGGIEIYLDQKESEFDYYFKTGVGSISLNGNKVVSVGDDDKNNIINGADKRFEAESGVGSIQITTK